MTVLRTLGKMSLLLLLGWTIWGCGRGGRATGPAGATRPGAPSPILVKEAQALRLAGEETSLGRPQSLKTYTPEQMYEAIDGEADLFLSYGGRGLVVAHYQAGDTTVSAELFDQARSLDAFGVFSQLRQEGARPLEIGAEGLNMVDQAVFFWKSRYFVRVAGTGAQQPRFELLEELARNIAAKLTGPSDLPEWTKALPSTPAPLAPQQYVAQNVLGYGFLSNAVLAKYRAGAGSCSVVLARAETEAAAQGTAGRLKEVYQGGAPEQALADLGADTFLGKDPEARSVWGVRSGQYLLLAIGDCRAGDAVKLLQATLTRLKTAEAGQVQ